MNERTPIPTFHSALAPWIEKFIAEKHACGYKYAVEGEALQRLDRFLREQGLETAALPRARSSAGSRRIRMRVPEPSGHGSAWSAAWPSSSSGRGVRPTSRRPD